MSFTAACPYCHVMLQNVPHEKLGASVTCPRCKNLYTVAPMAEKTLLMRSGVKAIPQEGVGSHSSGSPSAPHPVGHAAAVLAALPDIDAPRGDLIMPNRMSEEISDPRELLPLYKRYNNLGVVAFFCSCAGLMVASFESVGWMAIPLAAAGLVLGVLAVLSLEPRKGGAGFPVASVCVSVPALLLLIFFPGALGVQRGREYELSPDLVTQMAVSRGDALAETHERVREADWLDASTQSVELGDVRVRVLSAAVKKIQVNSAHGPRESTDKFLVVTLQFMNKSVARTVSFTSWDMVGPSAPALGGPTSILSAFDNKGKTYAMLLSAPGQEPVGHVRNTTLFPGKPVQDVLVFAAPSADVEFIRLQLAATAFGAKGNLHLQIPKRMIAFK